MPTTLPLRVRRRSNIFIVFALTIAAAYVLLSVTDSAAVDASAVTVAAP